MERLDAIRQRIPCGNLFQVIYNKILFQSIEVKSVFVEYSTTNMPHVSAALQIATTALLFLTRIRFPAHNSLVGTLRER